MKRLCLYQTYSNSAIKSFCCNIMEESSCHIHVMIEILLQVRIHCKYLNSTTKLTNIVLNFIIAPWLLRLDVGWVAKTITCVHITKTKGRSRQLRKDGNVADYSVDNRRMTRNFEFTLDMTLLSTLENAVSSWAHSIGLAMLKNGMNTNFIKDNFSHYLI